MLLIHLNEPPRVALAGVGVHGAAVAREVFRLPDLWQLHLYGYAGELVIDGTPHPIRPGHVSLVPPDAPVEFRYLGRSEHLFAHLWLPETGEPSPVPVMQDAGAQASALSELLHNAIAAAPGSPARASAEIWTALWRVVRLPPPVLQGAPHPAVTLAVAHIEAHLARPLAVPDVARAAQVSHNQLTRLFRAETGDTVTAYIRRRRLHRARHLLLESTLSIPAVAASVGIADLQAFNKACRRELGASPRAVRATAASTAAKGAPVPPAV
ncbi:AraC family transcriptional regulator [Streptomyces sp. NBC_01264]|uniref:AraC family transcriptional regulator n=1 Tax=Streptomyces sp. NBC_01264 TaxID=2903804 RepID=UPI0022522D33|nr:helix-turn-helix domain-containing protein [Streptomyces sp. NBC_01264]MCX4782460.1 helix-turn-helix domain-containing protein [Streptomyces sp. NBC_01264]